jgi:hypothetical protein
VSNRTGRDEESLREIGRRAAKRLHPGEGAGALRSEAARRRHKIDNAIDILQASSQSDTLRYLADMEERNRERDLQFRREQEAREQRREEQRAEQREIDRALLLQIHQQSQVMMAYIMRKHDDDSQTESSE